MGQGEELSDVVHFDSATGGSYSEGILNRDAQQPQSSADPDPLPADLPEEDVTATQTRAQETAAVMRAIAEDAARLAEDTAKPPTPPQRLSELVRRAEQERVERF